MSPTSPSRHQNRLTPLHQTIRNAVKSAIIAPAKYIKQNPSSIAHKYALLIAGATLSRPLLTLLPLGPFGPLFAILSTSFARFKLRQHAAGSYYALLHSAGLQGISGQALSLASFMGLGAVFGPTGAAAQSWFTSVVLSAGGYQASLIGIALSLLTNLPGFFAAIPGFISGTSAAVLYNEVRSFAMFKGLGWALKQAETRWREFVDLMLNKQISVKEGGQANWKSQMLRFVTAKVDWLLSYCHRPDKDGEAMMDWEMVGESSGVRYGRTAGPMVPCAFPKSDDSESVCAWLEDLEWDDATVSGLDDCD